MPDPASDGSGAATLATLAGDYWEWRLADNPLSATRLGDHRYDDRLPDVSAAGREARVAAVRGFADRLAAIEQAALAESDRVTAEVLEVLLARGIAEHADAEWEWQVDQIFGPQVWFFNILNYHPTATARDCANLAARFEAFGGFLDDHMAALAEGPPKQRTSFRGAVERVIAQCRAHVERGPEGCPLATALEALPELPELSDAERGALAGRLRAAIADVVLPAVQRFGEFLEATILPVARTDPPGIAPFPGAAQLYAHAIEFHTRPGLTAEALHATGLAEVQRLRAAMDDIARAHGHERLEDFVAALSDDPANTYDSRDAVTAHARALLAEATSRLPDLFGTLPTTPCVVTPIEPHREADSVAAFYNGPPADGSRPGIYYVNTFKPEARSRYNMPALTIHEAVPGHHLQIALAGENTALPDFRRFSHFTAYIEGWALYSERLGEEIGLYKTDLELLGMYTYEAWRACRLVVDTGLHHFGWSRQQAIDFMTANLALSETEIVNEVDRYIIWPGQALAYKVGQLEILALRDEARAALGDRFRLKDFHDTILAQGAVPLAVLRAIVERWVAAVQAG